MKKPLTYHETTNLERRKVIKMASALGGIFALGGLSSFSAFANENSDFKALVYIFLKGGNDSFNLLVPKEAGTLRDNYENGRRVVALPASELHSLNLVRDAKIYDGASYNGFGLHPSCSGLAKMFNDQELGFIANVGTLVQPVNREQFSQGVVPLPPQLFSHSDQQVQYQSEPSKPFRFGWGGRAAEMLKASNISSTISPLLSTDGLNPFQVSLEGELNAFVLGRDGAAKLRGVNNDIGDLLERYNSASSQGINYMSQRYSSVYRSAELASSVVNGAFDIAEANGVDYNGIFESYNASDTKIGQQLKVIAKMIAGRDSNSNNRPIYYATMGGFDNHQDLLSDHAVLMEELNNAINAFRDALVAQNDFDKTLAYVGSEFARTFTPNGDDASAGTDHGWGGHAIVFGGMVQGGNIFGTHPDLKIEEGLDAQGSRGRWIPTSSIAQVGAPMAKWLGVSDADLNTVFPTLPNFDSPFEAQANLDFIRT